MPTSLRAIIFDFNGVIADDEAPHFYCFRQSLAEEGLNLSKEDYYGLYGGMDERHCAAALLAAVDERDPTRLQRILARKAALFREYEAHQKPPLFPGAVQLVKQAALHYRLAVASGGRRSQILFALTDTPVQQELSLIISADECPIGKPDPAIYLMALERINGSRLPEGHSHPGMAQLRPAQCLVIEDSLAGIQAARSAGMKVAAVATTYEPHRLTTADLVLPSLDGVALEQLEALFK